jgi:uncharacterized membrane protein (DUF2068 family)
LLVSPGRLPPHQRERRCRWHRGANGLTIRFVASAPLGVRLIVAYKYGKAALQATAAVALFLALRAGFALQLAHLAIAFGDHAVHPLAVRLGRWLSKVVTPTHLEVLAILLGADSIVSAVEGWALRRGHRWGRWLIVLTTGALIPLEIYEIARRPRVGRIVVLIINLGIVLYLASRLRREKGVPEVAATSFSPPPPEPRPPPAPPSP